MSFPRVALLIPDTRFSSDNLVDPPHNAASLPVPGTPTPASSTFAALEASGEQSYLEEFTIKVAASGYPDEGGQIYYENTAGEEKGWNEPVTIMDATPLTSGPASIVCVDAMTLKDGRGAMVYATTSGFTAEIVEGITRTVSATSTAVISNVALGQFANGIILIMGYIVAQGSFSAWMWDLDAGTIKAHATRCLTTTSTESCSMAILDDIVSFFQAEVQGTELYLKQYASVDLGTTYTEIDDFFNPVVGSSPIPSAQPTVVTYRGLLVCAYSVRSSTLIYCRFSSDPLSPMSGYTTRQVNVPGGSNPALGPYILVEEDESFITFFFNQHNNPEYLMAARPADPDLLNWPPYTYIDQYEQRATYETTGSLFYGGDFGGYSAAPPHTAYTQRQAVCFTSRGQPYMIAWANYGAASSSSIPLLLTMGGWTSYPTPRNYSTGDEALSGLYSQAFGLGIVAFPAASTSLIASDGVFLPSNVGWTLANVAATAANSLWSWNFSGGTAQGSYSKTVALGAAPSSAHELYASWRVDPEAAGSLVSDAIAARFTLDSSGFGFDISVRLTPTQINIYDNRAAAGTVYTRLGDYFVFHGTGTNILIYNGADPLTMSLIATLTAGASTGTALTIAWGQIAASTSKSSWSFFNSTLFLGEQGIGPRGRRVSSRRGGIGVGGLLVGAQSGPLALSDEWALDPRFLKGVDNLDLIKNASPNIFFEGDGTGEFVFEPSEGDATIVSKGAYGVLLVNTNIKSANWRRLQGAAFWALVGAIQPVILNGVSYTRSGNIVTPLTTAGVDGDRWLDRMELQNCWVDFGSGRESEIDWSSEGVWKTGPAAHANASFRIKDIPAGAPTSGTMSVYYHSVLCVINNETVAATQYKLSDILHFGTDLKIGGILVGAIAHASPKHARGRVVDTISNTTKITSRSGASWVTKDGPSRRRVRLAWTDAFDLSGLHNGDVDPETLTAGSAGTNVVGAVNSVKSLLEGLQYELGGETVPLGYIAALEELTSGTVQNYVGRRGFVYGRMTTGVTSTALSRAVQEETKTDVVRVSAAEILEEV